MRWHHRCNGHGLGQTLGDGEGQKGLVCCSPWRLFNLYAEYIMRNAGLEETQAGIKIAGRNINNLRCADDTTLMAESEEELKSLLMKVKVESEKVGLELSNLSSTFRKLRSWHVIPSIHGNRWGNSGKSG